MLLTVVFVSAIDSPTNGLISVRTLAFEPTLEQFPTLAFAPVEQIVKEKEFKAHVVKLLLEKFPHKINDIHSIFVSLNDKVIRRWRSSRGHFKEVTG
jgi:hypothetical protein